MTSGVESISHAPDVLIDGRDDATVVTTSQALAAELALDKLIAILLRAALEHAGAQRGVLIVRRADELRVAAEASTRREGIVVGFQEEPVSSADLPDGMIHFVARTRTSVILGDASSPNPYAEDPYIARAGCRSVLCLPLAKQANLVGVLYLENNLVSHAFTPGRVALLTLLASQAAISLDNARLYLELDGRLRFWTMRSELATSFASTPADQLDSRIDLALGRVGSFFELDRVTLYGLSATPDNATVINEWRVSGERRRSVPVDATPFANIVASLRRGEDVRVSSIQSLPDSWSLERETLSLMGVRSVVCLPMAIGGVTIAFMGLVSTSRQVDWPDDTFQQMHLLSEVFANALARQHAVIDLERSAAALDQAQRDLAHASRTTTMGELAASIAHEINQPLAAIVANAGACLNWLSTPQPNLANVRAMIEAMARDGDRAGQVLTRIRALLSRSLVEIAPCDLSAVVDGVLPLVRGQLRRDGVALETSLASNLPRVKGDPVQLQQVVLNLVLNAAEASREVPPEQRRIVVRTEADCQDDRVLVVLSVEDSGVGFQGGERDHLFETFYTTKPTGLGMGLSISRSIIERHEGRIWAEANAGPGATFRFALPVMP